MSKKLSGNGLFESSRMMLPEHREAYLDYRKELNRKPRPVIDDQKLADWSRLIQESLRNGRIITISVYDPAAEIVVTGQVLRVDADRLLFYHGRRTWIPFSDIMDICES